MFGIGEDENGELYLCASDNIGPTGTVGVVYRIKGDPAVTVPAISTWGLLIMTLILMTAARIYFGRRADGNIPNA